jgi:surface antigen
MKAIAIALIGSLGLMTAVGCESLPGDRQTQGAVIGGLGGAAAGATVAGSDNRLTGALIGGALGAGGGWLIGRELDKNDEQEARQAHQRAQESPARPQDVHNAPTADLNRDGFVTLDEVIAMQQAGLSDHEMVQRLEATGQIFALSVDQEQQLRNAGVSQNVIQHMRTINRDINVGAAGEPISSPR